ncbi:MAG: hypothetical protein Q4E36_03905 [Bacillota bacterium]|nr:hypothetical protein [Bacillota bacterium]
MDNNEIYLKSKSIGQGNLFFMFLSYLLPLLVVLGSVVLVSVILPTTLYLESVESYLALPREIFADTTYLEIVFGKPVSYGLIKMIIMDLLSIISFMALVMAVLDFVEEYEEGSDEVFSIKLFFINLKTYIKDLFLIALIFSILSIFTRLIPYVGYFMRIFLKIILFFVSFIIKEDKISNPFTLIKEAHNRTKGYKFNLFKLTLKFATPVFIAMVISLVLYFLNVPGEIVYFVIGVFVFRAFLYINIAFGLAYQDLVAFENFKENAFRS